MRILFNIILIVLGVFATHGVVEFFDLLPQKPDVFEQLAQRNMDDYTECKQARSYAYMKHHRQMIKNLIETKQYDRRGSFPVDSQSGTYDLIYYDIGGYSFQKDGTLFGSHEQ